MFKLCSNFKPTGDQPEAIKRLTQGLESGLKYQTLLGVTGSGKTYTIANVIANVNKPTIVISHNKTLAAQLYQEFKEFFPENSVHYFVSYYDYYQPEAYIPHSDTYIEKDALINEEIDRLRHAATQALLTRNDVIIVASVSCIYNLGSPKEYENLSLEIKEGQKINIQDFTSQLSRLQYERDIDIKRGKFRCTQDEVEIFSATGEQLIKVRFKKNGIDKIFVASNSSDFELVKPSYQHVVQIKIFPAKYWVVGGEKLNEAIDNIKQELSIRVKELKKEEKFLEAERLARKTLYDMEMIRRVGYCHGIENYSSQLEFRKSGQPPFTLLDFFRAKGDFLTVIDESHITIPQIRGMFHGDKSRKSTLIDYGFRLPSALDNRPLMFNEFEKSINQTIYVSATPSEHELKRSHKKGLTEQFVRPTGLLDPTIEIKPSQNQINDLLEQIKARVENQERVLLTTLTKKMAEDLSEFLLDQGIKVNYIHSDIKALDRLEIIQGLRTGLYDVIVGVNLLREGLDLPEVSLIAILDADKEGFLRNATSLIQTMGRASRHINGHIILYADKMTKSMKLAISETNRRRKIQEEYNEKNQIIPQSIKKAIKDYDLPKSSKTSIRYRYQSEEIIEIDLSFSPEQIKGQSEADKMIEALEKMMQREIKKLNFEQALIIRTKIQQLKKQTRDAHF